MTANTRRSIQALLVFFGPYLLPRLLATYRSIRSRPASQIRPLPEKTSYALWILFFSGFIAFCSTLPTFSNENVFRATQSRLQTPAGVIMTRLAALRPLDEADERLRSVLDAGGLPARLLYARYGPAAVRDCPFASPDEIDSASAYLLYAAPDIAEPHLLHLFALAVATSGWLSGREGARWRTIASIIGIVLGVAEFWFLAAYDNKTNQRSTRLNEIDFVHWKLQVWRGLAIAAIDGLLGLAIWLEATGRAFINPPTPAEQITEHSKVLEAVLGKVRGLGVVRNGAMRSADMRQRADDYWKKEDEVMRDIFEEPEVLQAQRNAVSRLDVRRVGQEAEQFLTPLLGNVDYTQSTRYRT